jgi:hypothetical protein
MEKNIPDIHATMPLQSGRELHLYFDHPDHNGFEPHDHAEAASLHAHKAQMAEESGNTLASNFHRAQAILHAHAAEGRPTKMRTAPSKAVMDRLPAARKQFWINQSHEIDQNNSQLADLEPYRMNHVLSHGLPVLNKSRTYDYAEVRNAELQNEEVEPPMEAETAHHPDSGLVKQILAARHAQRHAEGDPDGTIPAERPKLEPDMQDAVRAIVANRQQQRGR